MVRLKLARQSTLLLLYLQVWWTWMHQLRFNIFWIGRMRTGIVQFILQFVTMSISTIESHQHNWKISSLQANSRPRYIPHTSAWRTSQTPILQTKYMIHLSLASRSRPLQLEWSPFSLHTSSQLSLTHPLEDISKQYKLFRCAEYPSENDYEYNVQYY